ncbi:MAG: hypothetical protein AAF682_27375 [Planctomycetota bacterium]
MNRLSALPLGALLGLSPVALAQHPPFASIPGYDRIALPGLGLGASSYSSSTLAELTGDGDTDAAVLAGGDLFVLRNPGLWNSVLRYDGGSGFLDLATHERAQGPAAGLLATDGHGVRLLRVVDDEVADDAVLGDWTSATLIAARALPMPLSTWTMVALYSPGEGLLHVFYLEQQGAWPLVPTPSFGFAFPLSAAPLDLALSHLDATDFLPEIAVATATGVQVYGSSGQHLSSYALPAAFAALAPLPDPSGSERLVAVTGGGSVEPGSPGGTMTLLKLGLPVEQYVLDGPPTGVAITTGAGAQPDIIIGEADAQVAWWFDGQTGTTFSEPAEFGASSAESSGSAPLAGQLDFDDVADVLLFTPDGEAVLYTAPQLGAPGPEGISVAAVVDNDGLSGADADEVLLLSMCPTEQFPTGTNELEVTVWAWQTYTAHPVFCPEPMGSVTQAVATTTLSCDKVQPVVVQLDLHWPHATAPLVYGIQLRMLKTDASGSMRLRAKQFLLTKDCDIHDQIVGGLPHDFWSIDPCDSGIGGVHAPGIIRVPRFGIVFDDEHADESHGID